MAIYCGHEIQIYDGETGEPQKTGSIYNFDPIGLPQSGADAEGRVERLRDPGRRPALHDHPQRRGDQRVRQHARQAVVARRRPADRSAPVHQRLHRAAEPRHERPDRVPQRPGEGSYEPIPSLGGGLLAAAGVAIAIAGATAGGERTTARAAANVTITARDFFFEPRLRDDPGGRHGHLDQRAGLPQRAARGLAAQPARASRRTRRGTRRRSRRSPTPGSYTFVCEVHPGMTGTVNVRRRRADADADRRRRRRRRPCRRPAAAAPDTHAAGAERRDGRGRRRSGVQVRLTVSEPATINVRFSGPAATCSVCAPQVEPGTWTLQRPLPNGTYTYELWAVDAMGNRSSERGRGGEGPWLASRRPSCAARGATRCAASPRSGLLCALPTLTRSSPGVKAAAAAAPYEADLQLPPTLVPVSSTATRGPLRAHDPRGPGGDHPRRTHAGLRLRRHLPGPDDPGPQGPHGRRGGQERARRSTRTSTSTAASRRRPTTGIRCS